MKVEEDVALPAFEQFALPPVEVVGNGAETFRLQHTEAFEASEDLKRERQIVSELVSWRLVGSAECRSIATRNSLQVLKALRMQCAVPTGLKLRAKPRK